MMGNLESLSNEQLWAIVHQPFSATQDERLRELTALGKRGALSADEQGEMETLLEAVDRYVLLLKQRGHGVERRLKSGI